MFVVLFRRFKLLFLLGILILLIQVYLAYKSIKIPIESGNKLFVDNINKHERFQSIHHETKQSLNDDEDIINSNVQHQETSALRNDKEKTLATLLSELKFKPKCDILKDKEVLSAIQRAQTQECKEHIIDIACAIKSNTLYPKTLPNTCPNGNYIANRSIGCFKDSKKNRLLSKLYSNYKESNSAKKCIQTCLQSGYLFAGVQYSTECFCGNIEPDIKHKLPDSSCNMKCPADQKAICGGYFTMNVYETGIASKLHTISHLYHTSYLLLLIVNFVEFSPQVAELQPKITERKAKIVFLLTLNGRALRQVYRLIKSIYSVHNFYYIHVDAV